MELSLVAFIFATLATAFVLYLAWRFIRHRRHYRLDWDRRHQRRRFWGYE